MNSGKVLFYLPVVVYLNCKKYVQLGNDSQKISVLVYMSSEKYVQFGNNSLKISVITYMNPEKYIEFGNRNLVYMNFEKVSFSFSQCELLKNLYGQEVVF